MMVDDRLRGKPAFAITATAPRPERINFLNLRGMEPTQFYVTERGNDRKHVVETVFSA